MMAMSIISSLLLLLAGIKEIEYVASQGGFKFKEWIVSGQDIPEQVVSIKLPNSIAPEVEKALGVFWDVLNDEFYVKLGLTEAEINFVPRYSVDSKFSVDSQIPVDIKPKLTLRICLSFHAKTHDPLGLVLPTRMLGHLLFRVIFIEYLTLHW